jgi:hypothetical protein
VIIAPISMFRPYTTNVSLQNHFLLIKFPNDKNYVKSNIFHILGLTIKKTLFLQHQEGTQISYILKFLFKWIFNEIFFS